LSTKTITALALAAILAMPAGAQPVLLPPNVAGSVDAQEVEAFVAAFSEAVAEHGPAPLIPAGNEPCVVPRDCPEQGVVYWVQISGDGAGRVGVALRMDGTGEVVDRATGECAVGEVADLGRTLGTAVAAGESTGLDLSLRRAPGATAYLDGEPLGRVPIRLREPIAAGLHVVRVETGDGRAAVALLDAPVDDVARLDLDLSGVPRGRKVGLWPLIPLLLGGATAAILVATDPADIIGPDFRVTVVVP